MWDDVATIVATKRLMVEDVEAHLKGIKKCVNQDADIWKPILSTYECRSIAYGIVHLLSNKHGVE